MKKLIALLSALSLVACGPPPFEVHEGCVNAPYDLPAFQNAAEAEDEPPARYAWSIWAYDAPASLEGLKLNIFWLNPNNPTVAEAIDGGSESMLEDTKGSVEYWGIGGCESNRTCTDDFKETVFCPSKSGGTVKLVIPSDDGDLEVQGETSSKDWNTIEAEVYIRTLNGSFEGERTR